MKIFDSELFTSDRFIYGVLLMLLIPLLVIALNEVVYTLGKRHKQLSPPIKAFKNFILPLIALSIVLTQVIDIERGSTLMKLLETFIWILVINTFLALVNVIFFSGKGKTLFKTKIPQLFLDIFRIVLVLFGAAVVLSEVWGADLGGLVTALGLGSFVIGLALQDTLGNLFSGVALVYEKPFQEGDIISIDDHVGTVIEMNWRAIRLETREKELIVIPHLVIGHGTIKNYSRPTKVHIMKTEIGFAYHVPPNNIKDALIETCLATPGILHSPEPEVKTLEYGLSKVNYEIEFAIGDFKHREEIMDDFMTRVWYTARRYNLSIPLPQMAVRSLIDGTETIDQGKEEQLESVKELLNMFPIEKKSINEVIKGSKVEHYGKGETVIKQKDLTGSLYIVEEGKAELTAEDDEGRRYSIMKLERGDFFGEITLFTTKYSSFTVTAIEDLVAIVISTNEVRGIIEQNPRLAYYLDEMMDSRRLKFQKLQALAKEG
jgi:small-conductance mechanosensitive channel